MTIEIAVQTEKEIVTAMDMLMHRATCGYAVNRMCQSLSEDAHVLCAADITHGIDSQDELVAYVTQALGSAAQGMFAPTDCAEILKPVAEYCKGRELTMFEAMFANKLRSEPKMANGPSVEDKDEIDFAVFAFGKKPENQEHLPLVKSLLLLSNISDMMHVKAKGDFVESIMSTATLAWVMGTKKGREDLGNAYFKRYEEKFAGRLTNNV